MRDVPAVLRWSRAAYGALARRSRGIDARDVDDTLALFEQLALDAWRRAGARGAARVFLRSVSALARDTMPRNPRGVTLMIDSLLADTRLALRGLRRSPGYAFVVVFMLAVGVGSTTAVFTLVNSVLVQPLRYPNPDRLVAFWGTTEGALSDHGNIAYLNFVDVRERAQSYRQAAAYDEWTANLNAEGEPERLAGAAVNAEFFDVLEAQPYLGRFFYPDEDIDGNDTVVVLSHGLWQRKFGADADIIGRSITLNDHAYEVVGVTAPDFEDPLLSGDWLDVPELWRPLGFFGLGVDQQPNRGSSSYRGVARLADGVTADQANEELAAIMGQLEREFPNNNVGKGMVARPLVDTIVGPVRSSLWLLFGAVGLVLAIATINVAGLVGSRASTRGREAALRSALGAGQARLTQLFLVEGLVVAAVAGVLGCGLAALVVRSYAALGGSLPRVGRPTLDLTVLGFAALIALATGVVCGLAPARWSRRLDLHRALRTNDRTGTESATAGRARRVLIVAEVALAVVLLAGAGLFMRSLLALTGVDKGLETGGRLVFTVSLPYQRYGGEGLAEQFFGEFLAALEASPGVDAAATTNILPLSGSYDCTSVWATDQPEPEPNQAQCPQIRTVSLGYLDTIGARLVRGRLFEPSDGSADAATVVINESFARQLWPGADPIGRQIHQPEWLEPRTVVGVVAGMKHESLDEPERPAIYFAYAQQSVPWHNRTATVVLRTMGSPTDLVGAAREALRAIDPTLPMASVATLDEVVRRSVAGPAFRTRLLAGFATVALILSAVGLYGLVAQAVRSRRREMAIKLALGAATPSVGWQVIRWGMGPVALGLAFGLGGTLALSSVLRRFLFGVTPMDPVALIGVVAVLFGVASLAVLVPSVRAMRTDPMVSLRDAT